MGNAKKLGYIPGAPTTPPPLHPFEYIDSEEPHPWDTAGSDELVILTFRRSAARNRSRVLTRFFRWKLTKLGFADEALGRLVLGLGEAVPNAMTYAVPGSSVGVVLIISGRTPNRELLLLVSNFIKAGESIPTAEQVPSLEEILYETHGRGTGILKAIASDFAVALSEDYDLLTVVRFKEQFP